MLSQPCSIRRLQGRICTSFLTVSGSQQLLVVLTSQLPHFNPASIFTWPSSLSPSVSFPLLSFYKRCTLIWDDFILRSYLKMQRFLFQISAKILFQISSHSEVLCAQNIWGALFNSLYYTTNKNIFILIGLWKEMTNILFF